LSAEVICVLIRNAAPCTYKKIYSPLRVKRKRLPQEPRVLHARSPEGQLCPIWSLKKMKRTLMAAGLMACLAGSQAFGQTVGLGPADTIVVAPEQRTVIKEYVVKERIAPLQVQERIVVGTRLPADVELRTVPSNWGPNFSKYRYVYSDDRVFLVEPSNRTVIQVID
jgi:Protein of unknown function (DUF1236)